MNPTNSSKSNGPALSMTNARNAVQSAHTVAVAGLPVSAEAPNNNLEQSRVNINLTNSSRLIDLLKLRRVGTRSILSHLENDRGLNIDVRISLTQTVRNVEGSNLSSDQLAILVNLESYLERLKFMTTAEVAENRNEQLEAVLDSLVNQVLSANEALSDRDSTDVQDITRTGLDVAAGGLSSVLERINNAPDSAKVAILAGVGLALMYIAKSQKLRKYLFYGAVTIGGLALVKPITGRSLPEWMDRGINWASSSSSGQEYANYFNLEYSDANAKARVDLLLETIRDDNPFARRSFKDITEAHRNSTGNFPQSFLRGTSFSSVSREQQPTVMYYSVGLIVDKFGPGSRLYRDNQNVREKWEELQEGRVSWREGVIQLFSLDPASPSYREASERSTQGRNQVDNIVASNTLNFQGGNLSSISAKLGESVSTLFKSRVDDGLTRTFRQHDPGFLNRWLNRRIDSVDVIDRFSPPLGTKIRAARESSNGVNFENGVFFGGYKVDISSDDFNNREHRAAIISEYITKFYDAINSNKDFAEGGMFDLIYGAEIVKDDGSGEYYLAFTYRNPNHASGSMSMVDSTAYFRDDRNFASNEGFRLNYYQRLQLKSLYNLNSWDELNTLLTEIRENHVPSGTLQSEFTRTRLMTPELRDEVLARRAGSGTANSPSANATVVERSLSANEQQSRVDNLVKDGRITQSSFDASILNAPPAEGVQFARLNNVQIPESIVIPSGVTIRFESQSKIETRLPNIRSIRTWISSNSETLDRSKVVIRSLDEDSRVLIPNYELFPSPSISIDQGIEITINEELSFQGFPSDVMFNGGIIVYRNQ